MFEAGLAAFIGLAFISIKLHQRTMLRLLHLEIPVEVFLTLLTLRVLWGTLRKAMSFSTID